MSTHYTIEYMQEYATQYGGKCLSNEFWNIETKLKWMCSIGHTWEAAFQAISQGAWCPACLKIQARQEKVKERREKIFEKLITAAKERGVECLSNEYLGGKIKLQFQCKEGHKFFMIAYSVLKDRWCPKCSYIKLSEKFRHSIEVYRATAIEREGKLLSENYINSSIKLVCLFCQKNNEIISHKIYCNFTDCNRLLC